MNRHILNITFHNPNTNEETASFLTKAIAEELAEKIIWEQSGKLGSGQSNISTNTPA